MVPLEGQAKGGHREVRVRFGKHLAALAGQGAGARGGAPWRLTVAILWLFSHLAGAF